MHPRGNVVIRGFILGAAYVASIVAAYQRGARDELEAQLAYNKARAMAALRAVGR